MPEQFSAEADVIIGSVTRFSPIKDPLNLVEAFVALHESETASGLVMIGDGELLEEVRRRLRSAGLGSLSWLPGSRDDVAELLRQIDMFVLGSLREGISNTVLEAMASGLPVIATDTGGNRELIEPGVNGMLVAPGDCLALRDAIRPYIEDPQLRRAHGRASRARVESLFSIDKMVDRYRELYASVITDQAA